MKVLPYSKLRNNELLNIILLSLIVFTSMGIGFMFGMEFVKAVM